MDNTENKINNEESSVVKPHHRQKRLIDYDTRNDSTFKVRNTLNIIFMLLTIIGICIYMWAEHFRTVAYAIILIGVVLKIVEVALRMFRK